MNLFTTVRFRRELKALLKNRRLSESIIQKTLKLLATNPRNPTLRLHKLTGTNNFSVSVDKDLRIILSWEDNSVYLLRVGSHDEVY